MTKPLHDDGRESSHHLALAWNEKAVGSALTEAGMYVCMYVCVSVCYDFYDLYV